MKMKAHRKRNPARPTATEREDARDLALIKRESKKPTYSFNEFMKELGYDDLVTPRKQGR